MYHKRSMTDRALAMLLSLVLCLTMVPQLVFAAAGASDGTTACVTVKDSAVTAYETTTGALLTVPLDDLFADSGSHALTYTMDDGSYGNQTKVTKDSAGKAILSFTNPTAGTYTPTITATCAESVTASVKLTITVKQGDIVTIRFDSGEERRFSLHTALRRGQLRPER